MNIDTGIVSTLNNEELQKILKQERCNMIEVKEPTHSDEAVAAWNEYITSRPETDTIEKIKMRQAFFHAWGVAKGIKPNDKEG